MLVEVLHAANHLRDHLRRCRLGHRAVRVQILAHVAEFAQFRNDVHMVRAFQRFVQLSTVIIHTFRSPHLNNIGMTQLPVNVHFLQYSPIADALRRNRTSIHLLDSDGSTRRQLDGAVHGGKRARADHRAELVVLQSRRW